MMKLDFEEFQIEKNNIRYLIKKIDRKLKNVTSDPEISGDYGTGTGDENKPLGLGLDQGDFNMMGGLSIANMVHQIDKTWETDSANKKKRYKRYQESMGHPEVEGVLNIYADEVCTEDQDGKIITVRHTKSEVRKIVEDCFERIGIYKSTWETVWEMCGFGDYYQEIVISQSAKRILGLTYLPRDIIQRVEKNGRLQGFKIDLKGMETQNGLNNMYATVGTTYKTSKEQEQDLIHPFRILHYKIPSRKYGVYGKSILDSIITNLENLQLMEKSLMIARVTRAAERRIFSIDVGNLQGSKALAYAKEAINAMLGKRRKSQYSSTGALDFQKDIFSASEDIVIPKRAGSEGNSIETLPQLNNASDIGDLEYLRDKIFPGVGIPRQYLFDDSFSNANLNLSSKSQPFAKKIKRIQRFYIDALYKIAIIELKLHNIPNYDIEGLELFMNNPSSIDERERVEIDTNKWGLIASIKSLNQESIFFPDYLIYSDYLGYDDDEIVEILKLNALQQANLNPFNAFPKEFWPDGADDLLMGQNAEQPAGAGDETPIGNEENPEIPAGVADAMGEPPAEGGGETTSITPNTAETPEVADFVDDNPKDNTEYQEDKFKTLEERKKKLLTSISESINDQIGEQQKAIKELREKRKYKENCLAYKKSKGHYEFMKIHGDLRGMNEFLSKMRTNDEEDYID